MARARQAREGFTLVELLVVITIIVVLLALLTPALDAAIRQAELATCAATIRSLAMGGLQYAADNKRYYPSRGPTYWDPLQVRLVDNNSGAVVFDLVRQLRPYTGADSFLDPLGGEVDLDEGSNAPRTALYSNYLNYWDWGAPHNLMKSMRRLGDRMTFTAPDGAPTPVIGAWAGGPRSVSFNVLVADLDERRLVGSATFNPQCLSGHPDDEGILFFFHVQDVPNPFVRGLPLPIGNVTVSWWQSDSPPAASNHLRGLTDNNYGFDDGSVLRLKDVEIDDPRLAKLPTTNLDEYQNSDRKTQLPAAGQ